MKILDRLPIPENRTSLQFGNKYATVHRNQVLVWVSVHLAGAPEPEENIPRFPALLDTGNNFAFSAQDRHIWDGTEFVMNPLTIVRPGYFDALDGDEVFVDRDDVLINHLGRPVPNGETGRWSTRPRSPSAPWYNNWPDSAGRFRYSVFDKDESNVTFDPSSMETVTKQIRKGWTMKVHIPLKGKFVCGTASVMAGVNTDHGLCDRCYRGLRASIRKAIVRQLTHAETRDPKHNAEMIILDLFGSNNKD
jgi:hypothetical protein